MITGEPRLQLMEDLEQLQNLAIRMSQQEQQAGPPYASPFATIGGRPTPIPDIPICSVFLAIYLTFAVSNMTIYQFNTRRHHIKFFLSLLLFGFSMARVLTMILRIASAERPHNGRLSLAATIFANVGILIIFVLNLIFAQRILRAEQPHLGWNRALRTTCKVLYALIGAILVMVITTVVLSSYTRNTYTLKACRDVQLAAITYLFVFTTLPLFHLAAAQFQPHSTVHEPLGHGSTSISSKKLIVTISSLLALTIEGFKLGTAFMAPRLASDPAWYHNKAAFYCFNFALEVAILAVLTISRVDRLFWVPDGSNGAGDYTRLADGHEEAKGNGMEGLRKV